MTEVIELKEENFEDKTSKGIWAVDFWAEWCGPCRMMAPEFEKAASEMKGKVKFGKVNVDDNMELSNRFEVMSIPTLIILKDGKEIGRGVGAKQKAAIISEINDSL